jgi:flagellar P-ring protein precursor FlgI
MRRAVGALCLLCAALVAAPEATLCGDFGTTGGDFGAPGGGFGGADAEFGRSYLPSVGSPTRIKNIVSIQGVRNNQLVGYGLVIGLNGTGDSLRNSPFTEQSMQAMLDRMGVNIRRQNTRTRNTAAVVITAKLPPFAQTGATIDVSVASIGDATSLLGGMLVMTPLYGADNLIYAVAQGPVTVSGYQVEGAAQTLTQNVPTSGRIPNGALVEREAPGQFVDVEYIGLELRNPDFGTAVRIAEAINNYGLERFGTPLARAADLRSVAVRRPPSIAPTRLMAEIGELLVEPDAPARVVIDERTGTIVIGRDVQISTVAVTHGNLTVTVTETPQVSQPLPFSEGQTVVTPETDISSFEQGGEFRVVRGASLQLLVHGLNRIGVKPQGIIAILQAIKTAGALQADLVVQ